MRNKKERRKEKTQVNCKECRHLKKIQDWWHLKLEDGNT